MIEFGNESSSSSRNDHGSGGGFNVNAFLAGMYGNNAYLGGGEFVGDYGMMDGGGGYFDAGGYDYYDDDDDDDYY